MTMEERTIPLREEVLRAHKQSVQIGEVVIRKEVITEEKTITVPISREELVIERLPAPAQPSDQPRQEDQSSKDQHGDPDQQPKVQRQQRSPQPLQEILKNGETLRIILHEEQVRVEKYPVVREEIHISKRQIEETRHFSDMLKREEVHIEHTGNVPIRENYFQYPQADRERTGSARGTTPTASPEGKDTYLNPNEPSGKAPRDTV